MSGLVTYIVYEDRDEEVVTELARWILISCAFAVVYSLYRLTAINSEEREEEADRRQAAMFTRPMPPFALTPAAVVEAQQERLRRQQLAREVGT